MSNQNTNHKVSSPHGRGVVTRGAKSELGYHTEKAVTV